jgi:hypothetical protein
LSKTGESYGSESPVPFTVLPPGTRAIQLGDATLTSSFLELFGRSEGATGRESDRGNAPTGRQQMYLLNSRHVREKIQKIVSTHAKGGTRDLYLNLMSRYPTDAEAKAVQAHIDMIRKQPKTDRLIMAFSGCRFSMPIREGFAKEIYLICSGGFMSIYAANNIARAIQRLAKRGDTGLVGIICNSNGDEAFERAVIPEFAQKLGTSFVQFVPRSPVIQACELEARAVVEHSPGSTEAEIFRNLAKAIMENNARVIPTPVNDLAELEKMYRQHLVKR